MNFSSLFTDKKTDSLIDKSADMQKYESIKIKLCTKRKTLEEILKRTDLSEVERTDHLSSLSLLTGSMATFGISEIDYQAFLATQDNTVFDEKQGTLFT
jgi:hypothetical protein